MFAWIHKRFFNSQFLRFGLIGAFNTILAQLLYLLLITWSFAAYLASGLADWITMMISYGLNVHFTYRQKPTLKSALFFPLSYVPGMLINMLVVYVIVDVMGFAKGYGKLFSLPLTIPVNFLCMSLIMKWFGGKR